MASSWRPWLAILALHGCGLSAAAQLPVENGVGMAFGKAPAED